MWTITSGDKITSTSSSFTAQVTRLGCNNGVTGEVFAPQVTLAESEIVVTFSVEALPDGEYTCPGNDVVPYIVAVGEAIGNRPLVDGACAMGSDAESTTFCDGGGVRWTP